MGKLVLPRYRRIYGDTFGILTTINKQAKETAQQVNGQSLFSCEVV